MIIRKATIRDLYLILPMFGDLINYLREHGNGNELFVDDEMTLFGGITEYLAGRINLQEQGGFVVLVGENEDDGSLASFLVGNVERLPTFCRLGAVGNIEYIYPLSLKSRRLARAFDAWAKQLGATARVCRCDVRNERAYEVYRRFEKSQHVQNVFVKPFMTE